jgi:hypothetical protein
MEKKMKNETTSKTSQTVFAILETIYLGTKKNPKFGIPSGTLYALAMSHTNLEEYTSILDVMKRSGLVTEKNFLLTATPKLVTVFETIQKEMEKN